MATTSQPYRHNNAITAFTIQGNTFAGSRWGRINSLGRATYGRLPLNSQGVPSKLPLAPVMSTPASIAAQGDEAAKGGHALVDDAVRFYDYAQFLVAPVADRDDQAARIAELGQQMVRNVRRGGGHRDVGVRRGVRPALRSIAADDRDIAAESGARQVLFGLSRQGGDDLDGNDARRQRAQDGGMKTRTAPHVQHGFRASQFEQLGHERDHVRLRDGLAVSDLQRLVPIHTLDAERGTWRQFSAAVTALLEPAHRPVTS